jgi:hypothetical protein
MANVGRAAALLKRTSALLGGRISMTQLRAEWLQFVAPTPMPTWGPSIQRMRKLHFAQQSALTAHANTLQDKVAHFRIA